MEHQPHLRECPGCKTILPITDYPADNRYGVFSPECRQMFDEIIVKEKEFGNSVHQLIVDAYMVQHPPHHDVQQQLKISKRFIDASIQSIGIHLIGLYLALEKKIPAPSNMNRILTSMKQQHVTFTELTPPADLGKIRAVDVRNALYDNPQVTVHEYEQRVWQWATSAWDAWKDHHTTIRLLCEKYLG